MVKVVIQNCIACQANGPEDQKMKEHADKRAHAQVSEIAIGDNVLVRQKKRNKFTTHQRQNKFV